MSQLWSSTPALIDPGLVTFCSLIVDMLTAENSVVMTTLQTWPLRQPLQALLVFRL